MAITQQDIAKQLGISQETVSRVLHRSHRARVSDETRRDVEQLARKVGYRPRNRTTHTIGLVVQGSTLGGEAAGAYLGNIEAALQRRNYRMAMMTVWDDRVEQLRESVSPKSIDGVIVTESFRNRVQSVLSPDVPAVFTFDEETTDPASDLVTMDTAGTLAKVTRHLLERGHREIALLTMHQPFPMYRHMEQGVRRELARAGVPQDALRVLEVDYGPRGNLAPENFARQLIEGLIQPPARTAIIAADLWRALPAAYALRDAGLRIPQDVSLISVFDSEYFPAMVPAITATTIYSEAVATRAVERLLEKIDEPDSPPCFERIAGDIIDRNSVGFGPQTEQ